MNCREVLSPIHSPLEEINHTLAVALIVGTAAE